MARIEAFEVAQAEGAVPSRVTSEATVAARRGPSGVARFMRSSPLGTVALVFLLLVIVLASWRTSSPTGTRS